MAMYNNTQPYNAAPQNFDPTFNLKRQIDNLMSQRYDLAAQLGVNVYNVLKDDADFREGREALFDKIEEIDTKREELEAEIKRINDEIAAQQLANSFIPCPNCGNMVSGAALFCTGCGSPIPKPEDTSDGAAEGNSKRCPACGAQVGKNDSFCMQCGGKI